MRIICISLLILFHITGLNAQVAENEEYNKILWRIRTSQSRYLEYQDIVGHPFSNEELIPGTIAFVSGNNIDSIPMRYNWYLNDMEFEYQGDIFGIPNIQEINYVIINGIKFVPFYYLKSINGYMIELVKGDHSLFRSEDVRFIAAKPPTSGYEEAQPARFDWYKPKYIVIDKEGKIIEIDTNKKKFPLQFPGFEKRIENYIKENKINPNKEEGLKAIIEMINSSQ